MSFAYRVVDPTSCMMPAPMHEPFRAGFQVLVPSRVCFPAMVHGRAIWVDSEDLNAALALLQLSESQTPTTAGSPEEHQRARGL